MEEEEWNWHQHDVPLTLSFTQIPLLSTFSLSFPPRPPFFCCFFYLPSSRKAHACWMPGSMCLRYSHTIPPCLCRIRGWKTLVSVHAGVITYCDFLCFCLCWYNECFWDNVSAKKKHCGDITASQHPYVWFAVYQEFQDVWSLSWCRPVVFQPFVSKTHTHTHTQMAGQNVKAHLYLYNWKMAAVLHYQITLCMSIFSSLQGLYVWYFFYKENYLPKRYFMLETDWLENLLHSCTFY